MNDAALPDTIERRRDETSARAARYPAAVRQALAFAGRIEIGNLRITMPDGQIFRFEGLQPGPDAQMNVRDLGFAKRLAQGGDIGFAEAYLSGEWDSPDLPLFLELFSVNYDLTMRMLDGRPVARLVQLFRHWLNRNTKSGARRNIHAHYDLGNRFYAAWLDPTMTYSSAVFTREAGDLTAAQIAKYRLLAEKTQIGPQHHVLEIGCGWGGFAEYAAQEIGCRVTGLTISKEQFDFAQKRIHDQGLSDRVELKLQDYRDERGAYDRIVSIEMFEAVGEDYWPAYFAQLHDRLKPGGMAGLQVITIQDTLFETYKRELDFIRGYVFPGGMLPTPAILKRLGEGHGLSLAAERIFGHDYAATLAEWRRRFAAAWPDIRPMGFDERFRRLWEYYLSYCEAGFRAGRIDVRQMVFARPA